MLERLGAAAAGFLAVVGEMSTFGARAAVAAIRRPFELEETARQLYEVGWRSVPLIATAGFAVGVVFSLHTRASLAQFGAEAMIPAGLGIALIRETGPLVAGLMFSGRVGAGIGAELGAMKVTEQIDALRVMATDPVGYLVVPRFVACILMTPVIVTFANFMGIAGGLFVAMTHTNVSAYSFIHSIETFTELSDFTGGLIKSMFFGGIVALVGCIKGMGAKEGAEGVGHATTGSVVTSIVWIFVINFFLSTWLFR